MMMVMMTVWLLTTEQLLLATMNNPIPMFIMLLLFLLHYIFILFCFTLTLGHVCFALGSGKKKAKKIYSQRGWKEWKKSFYCYCCPTIKLNHPLTCDVMMCAIGFSHARKLFIRFRFSAQFCLFFKNFFSFYSFSFHSILDQLQMMSKIVFIILCSHFDSKIDSWALLSIFINESSSSCSRGWNFHEKFITIEFTF